MELIQFTIETLRDLFAALAPEPTEGWIQGQSEHDRLRNPHNDPYKPPLRSSMELRAQWRYEYADAMMEARKKKEK